MKLVVQFVVASALALAAAAPAVANPLTNNSAPEANTLLERNTYLFTSDAREIARPWQQSHVRAHRATDAFASDVSGYSGKEQGAVNIQ